MKQQLAGSSHALWLPRLLLAGLMAVIGGAAALGVVTSGPDTPAGDLALGSTHAISAGGTLALPLPRLARAATVTAGANGTATVTFGINYAVANTTSAPGVVADQAIINVSVAQFMGSGGPLHLRPMFQKTIVDDRLDQPSLTRQYSVTLPQDAMQFLDSKGLGSPDGSTRAAALKYVSLDVEQPRDFRQVDGTYDWQEGASWTAADQALHTAASTEDSTVTVENNTGAGVYSLSNPATGTAPTATLANDNSGYGTNIVLSGQSVECVDQGNGSNPLGFSLLNGWDLAGNLPAGTLPPGDMVTEPVNADDDLGSESLGAAQNATAGAVDVGLSALGQATPGVESLFWGAAALMEPLSKVLTIASGVPLGAIVGLTKDLIQAINDSCNAYPNVFNLTATEPGGAQSSYSWADQETGLLQNYSNSYGAGYGNADGSPVTGNVQLSQSTGIASVTANGLPTIVNPYLAQVPVVDCGTQGGDAQNQCNGSGDNVIDVDWSANNPCPQAASNCVPVPSSEPQITVPGTSLCGSNNEQCPALAAPVPQAAQNLSTADLQNPHTYAVIGQIDPSTQINAMAVVGHTAYGGGSDGGLYAFTPAETYVNANGSSTTTSQSWTKVWSGDSPIDAMATMDGIVYFGQENGAYSEYVPGGVGAATLFTWSSSAYPKYMVAEGNKMYVALSNGAVAAVPGGQPAAGTYPYTPVTSVTSFPNLGSGAAVNAMTANGSYIFVGFTGGYVYSCNYAVGQCNPNYAFTQLDDGGFDSNVNALTTVGNTLYIGLENGAFVQQDIFGGDGAGTVIYNGSPGNNPTKNNNNPDSIAGMTAVGGNVFFGGCLGITSPVSSDFLGVSVYNGTWPSYPEYNGCDNPNQKNNSFFTGFEAASNNYALVASDTNPPVVYVAGSQGGQNFVYALESLSPFTTSTCVSDAGGCPSAAAPSPTPAPPPPVASLTALGSPQMLSTCGTGAYNLPSPQLNTLSGTSITSNGFQLVAPTSSTQSCTTTFAWNLNNAGSFPYGAWTANAYLDKSDQSTPLPLGLSGTDGQALSLSAGGVPVTGSTQVGAGGVQVQATVAGANALVLTLSAPATSNSSDVIDFSNDTLTTTSEPTPPLSPLGSTTAAGSGCLSVHQSLASKAAALWLLNDTTSSAADSSGHGNTAAIANASGSDQTPGAVTGCPNIGALGLNGTSTSVTAPSSASLNAAVTGNSLSVVSFFKLPSTGAADNPRVVANDHTDSSGHGFQLELNGGSNGVASGFFDVGAAGGTGTASWSQQLKPGSWYMYVGTYNGSTVTAYLNGRQVASGTTSGSLSAGSDPVSIGYDPVYNGDYLPGQVADVAVMPSALSTTQVASLWNAASGQAPPTPTTTTTTTTTRSTIPSTTTTTVPSTTTTTVAPCKAVHQALASKAAALWLLNDTGQTAKDSSGHANSAIINNTTSYDQTPGPVPGCPQAGAVGLNGTSSFVAAGTTSSTLNAAVTGTTLTVVAWFKLTSAPFDDPRVVANGEPDQSNDGFELALNGSPANGVTSGSFVVGTTSLQATATWNQQLTEGTWHLYVGTYNGQTATAYIDGQQVGTGNNTGSGGSAIEPSPYPVSIGYNPAASNDYFPGQVADVAVVPSVLASSQVQALWSAAQ